MAEELPNDPSLWPSNPSELLGVAANADATELKRAYTRLIRRFKPEQAPEAFRRIREAYETLLSWCQLRAQFHLELNTDTEEVEEVAPSQPAETKAPIRTTDEVAAAWELTSRGDFRGAYNRLVELASAGKRQSDVDVRLYWLLRVAPEVDSQRLPIDWLLKSIMENADYRNAELLRRDLQFNPELAKRIDLPRLQSSGIPILFLARIVHWRWLAFGTLRDHWAIVEDAPKVRGFFSQDQAHWLELLLVAADQLVWDDSDAAESGSAIFTWCLTEIEQMEHLARDRADLFDRFDQLRSISEEWRTIWRVINSDAPGIDFEPLHFTRQLLRIIPPMWNQASDEYQLKLWPMLEQFARDPVRWLGFFTRIFLHAGQIMMIVDQVVRGLRMPPSIPDGPLAIPRDFCSARIWAEYDQSRFDLLINCLDNDLDPLLVAEQVTLAGLVFDDGDTPQSMVQRDVPLRLVYDGVALFRG